MGLQVGRMFAPLIDMHVAAWMHHVHEETGATAAACLTSAATFAEPIQTYTPFLWEELEGMAMGSGLPIGQLLVLQARAEVLRAQKHAAASQPGLECTTFAVGGHRTADNAVLFGQNVDLVPFVESLGVIVRTHPNDAPATLMYTSAGLLGHNGMNEAGVGICANFINDPKGWQEGLPRYLLSRLALREESAEAALQAAMRPPRAASRNLLVADRQGMSIDAELLCEEAGIIHGADALLVHANHLEATQFRGYEAPLENSRHRRQRLQELLEGNSTLLTVADIQRFYRDHANAPHSLCAHPFPGRNLQTVVSVIGDLTSLKLYVAKGLPCRAAYATYTMATCSHGSLSVSVVDDYLERASMGDGLRMLCRQNGRGA